MPFNPTLSRLSPFERFLSIFTSVRPGEGASVFYLFISGFVLMFAYYLLKPVREALILTEADAEIRAYSVGIVALVLVFVIPLYKQLFQGLAHPERKSRVLRWVILFFISNLILFIVLGNSGVAIGIPYFVWLSIFNVMVVAQFWAFAADLFNTRTGQRLFPVIMVGMSVGAWAGANAAGQAFGFMGPYPIMLVATLLLCMPWALSLLAERAVPDGSENYDPPAPEPEDRGIRAVLGGFDTVFKSRYLVAVAALMFLLNMINTTGEFILSDFVKSWATQAVAEDPSLDMTQLIGQVMSSYYAWISFISLMLQLFVVARIFRYIGVRGAIVLLPLFMVAHYSLLALFPVFFLVRWLMVGENGINYSVQNTTIHALYLPLNREQKYVGKTTIDTFFVRFGDLAQAGLVFAGLNILGLGMYGFILVNGVLALMMLAVAFEIRRRHKDLIADKLANLPPKIVAPLPDVHAPSGRLLMFSLPDQCFFDPDPGDTLDYTARLAGGQELPGWVLFDRHNQTFTVRPPDGETGFLSIELTASDFEGLNVTGAFELHHGDRETPIIGPLPEPPSER
jgi:AAA family ATP:ADP antiporter